MSTDLMAPSAERGTTGPALPVSFQSLGRSFGAGPARHTVLRDINFHIAAGEVVAILGPSG